MRLKAYGIQPSKNGGVEFTIKKANKANKPASAIQTTTFGPSTSSRKYVPRNPGTDSTLDARFCLAEIMGGS